MTLLDGVEAQGARIPVSFAWAKRIGSTNEAGSLVYDSGCNIYKDALARLFGMVILPKV